MQSDDETEIRSSGESAKNEKERVATLSIDTLMGEQRMVRIAHEGEIYTLRLTRNNRLILTK